jgi:DNA-binding NarL/FixJ family response regulator
MPNFDSDSGCDSDSTSDSTLRRILLFAEDPIMFSMIREYLQLTYPNYRLVNDCAEILQIQHLSLLAAARKADVVIWDLNQTSIIGAELTWALRLVASRNPLILITPFGADDTRRKAKALGTVGYLSKPFKLSDLGTELSHILDHSLANLKSI